MNSVSLVQISEGKLVPLVELPSGNSTYDVLRQLLESKRSKATRRTYQNAIDLFFQRVYGVDASPQAIAQFLSLPEETALALVLAWRSELVNGNEVEDLRPKANATVNNYLAALKSLVSFAHRLKMCAWTLEHVQGEKGQTYRDTRGIPVDEFKKMLVLCDRSTQKGKRDYALLRLLWENVPRRNEIHLMSLEHFDAPGCRILIYGKGRGSEAEWISISPATRGAIASWLKTRGEKLADDTPLFCALDRAHRGHRLTGDGLYKIVRGYAKQAGIERLISPHRLRHSGITALIEAGMKLTDVQQLSRHRNIAVLMRYHDNLNNAQQQGTNTLSDMLDENPPGVQGDGSFVRERDLH